MRWEPPSVSTDYPRPLHHQYPLAKMFPFPSSSLFLLFPPISLQCRLEILSLVTRQSVRRWRRFTTAQRHLRRKNSVAARHHSAYAARVGFKHLVRGIVQLKERKRVVEDRMISMLAFRASQAIRLWRDFASTRRRKRGVALGIIRYVVLDQ